VERCVLLREGEERHLRSGRCNGPDLVLHQPIRVVRRSNHAIGPGDAPRAGHVAVAGAAILRASSGVGSCADAVLLTFVLTVHSGWFLCLS
jgi:hypothetical protein